MNLDIRSKTVNTKERDNFYNNNTPWSNDRVFWRVQSSGRDGNARRTSCLPTTRHQ